MAIHYPNGKAYESGKQTAEDAVNYGGRGMTLEAELNASNQYYRAAKRAVIYKKNRPRSRSSRSTTLSAVRRSLKRLISKPLRRPTIMASTRVIMLTLTPKRPKTGKASRSRTFIRIRSGT